MSRKVYVHIGAPKTGTTYLQDRLALNAKSLGEHGVHVPTGMPVHSPGMFQFRVALDLLGQDWGGEPGHAAGTWDSFVRRTKRRSGSVILSHELLAPAGAASVKRLKHDLRGSEIHVVYSARDLGRQIPAAWQETVKQGKGWGYRRFLDKLTNDRIWFYQAFDLPAVLSTWSAGLPPEQVHVVTVPHHEVIAERPDTLWLRFCDAFGIDPAWAPADSWSVNPSMGMAETALVRKLNRRVKRTARRLGGADELVHRLLAERQLASRPSQPVRLAPRMHPWALEQAERWIEWVEESGVHVVGDLDELRPRPVPEKEWADPDRVSPREQLEAALDALSAMTDEAARRSDPDQQLVRRVKSQVRRMRQQQ
ncbi:MAG: hypothetical protein LH468_07975 [Nocardioides sp.]|nr:hypothetical protein [Nocardioides sp.]